MFKGDLVDYNHKYKSYSELNLIVDRDKKIFKAELKRVPKGESSDVSVDTYKL